MSDRRCGDCQACCTVMAVREIAKPKRVACSHLCARGCAIYETRPDGCRGYRCAWLDGAGAHADRPDRSGVMFHLVEPGIFSFLEVRERALNGQRAKALIARLAAAGSSLLIEQSDGRRSYVMGALGPAQRGAAKTVLDLWVAQGKIRAQRDGGEHVSSTGVEEGSRGEAH